MNSLPSTTLDSVLMRYMTQGTKMDHVTISTTNFNIDLVDVVITSVVRSTSDGEEVVHMTLSFTSQHLK